MLDSHAFLAIFVLVSYKDGEEGGRGRILNINI